MLALVYVLLVSNPLMVLVAWSLGGAGLRTSHALAGLALSATACCAFAANVWRLMVPEFRKTFHRHRTLATHVWDYWWHATVGVDQATQEIHFNDNEKVRAHDVLDFRESSWPREAVRAWLAERWARWTVEPPDFFTDAWIAAIPADLRPDLASANSCRA